MTYSAFFGSGILFYSVTAQHKYYILAAINNELLNSAFVNFVTCCCLYFAYILIQNFTTTNNKRCKVN